MERSRLTKTLDDSGAGYVWIKNHKLDTCYGICLKENRACPQCPIYKCLEKLSKYEDAEEQGRLLIVPREIEEIDDWLYAIIYDENFHTYDVSQHPIVDLCFSGTIITDAPLGDPGCEIWTPKDQEEYLVCFSEEDAVKKATELTLAEAKRKEMED